MGQCLALVILGRTFRVEETGPVPLAILRVGQPVVGHVADVAKVVHEHLVKPGMIHRHDALVSLHVRDHRSDHAASGEVGQTDAAAGELVTREDHERDAFWLRNKRLVELASGTDSIPNLYEMSREWWAVEVFKEQRSCCVDFLRRQVVQQIRPGLDPLRIRW